MLIDTEYWNNLYSAFPGPIYGYRPNDFVKTTEVMLRRNSTILVLCDGEGRNGVWLAEKGHDVTTVDWSSAAVTKAKALAEEKGVQVNQFTCAVEDFVESQEFFRPWDAIVAIFCQLSFPVWQEITPKLVSQFSPRGMLILEEFTPAQLMMGSGGPEQAEQTLTAMQAAELWPGLQTEIQILERRIFEGRQHRGLASVIQMLGHVPKGWTGPQQT